jgi:hypothetical protein
VVSDAVTGAASVVPASVHDAAGSRASESTVLSSVGDRSSAGGSSGGGSGISATAEGGSTGSGATQVETAVVETRSTVEHYVTRRRPPLWIPLAAAPIAAAMMALTPAQSSERVVVNGKVQTSKGAAPAKKPTPSVAKVAPTPVVVDSKRAASSIVESAGIAADTTLVVGTTSFDAEPDASIFVDPPAAAMAADTKFTDGPKLADGATGSSTTLPTAAVSDDVAATDAQVPTNVGEPNFTG